MHRLVPLLLLVSSTAACSTAPLAPAESAAPQRFGPCDRVVVAEPGTEVAFQLSSAESHDLVRELNRAYANTSPRPRSDWRHRTAPSMSIRLLDPSGDRELQVLGTKDAIHDVERGQILFGPFAFLEPLSERLVALSRPGGTRRP